MLKFIINKYITLKLEGNHINIYICNKLFRQCKYLLLVIPVNGVKTLDEIESIDEVAEKLDKSMEYEQQNEKLIPINIEFWGHCSNIQAWYENNYDTRLLDSNFSFPLLKELVKMGDSKAKNVFKEEIVKRILSKS